MSEQKRTRRIHSVETILKSYDSKTYDVITFRCGRRVGTYGSLSLVGLAEYLLEVTGKNFAIMVFETGKLPCDPCEWSQAVWEEAVKEGKRWRW